MTADKKDEAFVFYNQNEDIQSMSEGEGEIAPISSQRYSQRIRQSQQSTKLRKGEASEVADLSDEDFKPR